MCLKSYTVFEENRVMDSITPARSKCRKVSAQWGLHSGETFLSTGRQISRQEEEEEQEDWRFQEGHDELLPKSLRFIYLFLVEVKWSEMF